MEVVQRATFPERRLPMLPRLCLLRVWSVAIVAITSSAPSRSFAQDTGRPALRAGSGAASLRVDGRLDEAAWSAADSIGNLTQIDPVEGGVPSQRTVVRVLADGDAIIFGLRADDTDAARIVSFARARDASLGNEDHIRIVLDTYGDERSGYVFAINPTGARYDALISDQGDENSNWDAIWEGQAVRTATGWSAEIRIPLKSILFRRGLTAWGFNVQRRIQRHLENDRWASPERDYDLTRMSRAGMLTALPPFDLGLGLTLRPSVSGGGSKEAPGASIVTEGRPSLDATQRIGANSLASVTINTDFAETEVDTRRTNLTRFPLSFPEKRTFFLEGSDIFGFGIGLGDTRPFFSRRIGLLNSTVVPITVGTKVIGRQGGTNFGALVVRTGDSDSLPSANTMSVVRIKRNVLAESSVGMIASAGDPQGRANSWLTGADAVYQTSHFRGDQNFVAGVWGLATNRDGLTGRRNAVGGQIAFPNDLWDIVLRARSTGDGFLPSLGFVPRPGVREYEANLNYSPRPRRPVLGLRVRQINYELESDLVTDLAGEWESYKVFTAPVNWRLESGDHLEFNVIPTGERLVAPFEIEDNVEIAAGSYHGLRYRAMAGLASKRPVSGRLSWAFGDFYTGTLDEIDVSAVWKPSALFSLEMTLERNIGRLIEGSFTQDLLGTRVRVNVSPDLQVNSFVQYDNESRSLGTNTRLRWTFVPEGDLFVVYNHNLVTQHPITRDRRIGFASNQLLVKAQYAVRY